MTKHNLKREAVKASLTSKLKQRTARAIAKHGVITQARIDQMRAEREAKLARREARRQRH